MAVLIPSQFAGMRKIDVGTVLDLERVNVIEPKRRRYKLAELMQQFKPAHRHAEWNAGGPRSWPTRCVNSISGNDP